MSDQQQGPGWWLASDGRWYPPEQAPGAVPGDPGLASSAEPAPPSDPGGPSPSRPRLLIAGAVVVVVLVAVALLLLGGGDDGEDDTAATTSTEALDEEADPTDGEPTDGEPTEGEPDDGDVPDGFTLLEGDGVAMAVPEDWVQIDAADASLTPEELAELYPGASPELLEQGLAAFEQGAVLVATEVTSDDFADNVNVLEAPTEVPLDVLEQQGEQEITSLGGEVASVERVGLPAGEAVRLAYSIDGVAPDGSAFTVRGVQHYVPIDGRTYIITVSSGADPSPFSDPMAETFRLR
jgi:hypothetical protein